MEKLNGPFGIIFEIDPKPGECWTYIEGAGLCIARPDKTKPLVQIDGPLSMWTIENPLKFTFVGEDEPRTIFVSRE